MKRGLFLLSGVAGFALALLTFRPWRPCSEGHDLERSPIGGFRCKRCGKPFADFGEAGQMDDGYIDRRTTYGREPGEGTTKEWGIQ